MDDLRETIARAIWDGGLIREVDPTPWADLSPWTRQHILTEADAVIDALGLTEEPGHTFYGVNGPCEGVTPGPDPFGFQKPHYRRYVTDWKETP